MDKEKKKIYTDEEVFTEMKDKSRPTYVKSRQEFKNFMTGLET